MDRLKSLGLFIFQVIWVVGSIILILLGLVNKIWLMAGIGAVLFVFYVWQNKLWRKIFVRKK